MEPYIIGTFIESIVSIGTEAKEIIKSLGVKG